MTLAPKDRAELKAEVLREVAEGLLSTDDLQTNDTTVMKIASVFQMNLLNRASELERAAALEQQAGEPEDDTQQACEGCGMVCDISTMHSDQQACWFCPKCISEMEATPPSSAPTGGVKMHNQTLADIKREVAADPYYLSTSTTSAGAETWDAETWLERRGYDPGFWSRGGWNDLVQTVEAAHAQGIAEKRARVPEDCPAWFGDAARRWANGNSLLLDLWNTVRTRLTTSTGAGS